MLIEHLTNELASRSKKNPRYSVRAFAKALKIDSSTLSALMSGRRPLTPKTAKKILDQLDIDLSTKQKLLLSVLTPHEGHGGDDFLTLESDILEAISAWEHYAILSLFEIQQTKSTVNWIANRLNISTGVVINALKRLEKLALIKKRSNRWLTNGKQLTTTHNIPNASLRKANREYIEKALQSLESDSVEERDITGITMAISKKKLPEAKQRIKEFRRSLNQFLEKGEKDEVYRLNIQLFPLTKQKEKP